MREPKPFFRKQTGTWYVQIGKKQHNLGPDEQVAKQKYHALMAGRQPAFAYPQLEALFITSDSQREPRRLNAHKSTTKPTSPRIPLATTLR